MNIILFVVVVVGFAAVSGLVVAAKWRTLSPIERFTASSSEATDGLPATVALPPSGFVGDQPAEIAPSVAWLRGVKGLTGSYLLGRPVNRVGRSSAADIVLVLDTISRHQCTIRHDGQGWLLIPEPSRNGTFINSILVPPAHSIPLTSGDILRIGTQAELEIFIPGSGPAAIPIHLASATASAADNVTAIAGKHLIAVAGTTGNSTTTSLTAQFVAAGLQHVASGEQLLPTIRSLDVEIRQRAVTDPRFAAPGATVDAAVLEFDGRGWWLSGIHVGDGVAMVQHIGGDVITLTIPSEPLAAALAPGWELAAQEWRRRPEPGHRYLFANGPLIRRLGAAEVRNALLAMRDQPADACAGRLVELAAAVEPGVGVAVVVADVVTAAGVQVHLGSSVDPA